MFLNGKHRDKPLLNHQSISCYGSRGGGGGNPLSGLMGMMGMMGGGRSPAQQGGNVSGRQTSPARSNMLDLME